MPTISFVRLSDKTVTRYEALEKEGKLTTRQARALAGHRMLPLVAEAMHRRVADERERGGDDGSAV